MVTTPTCSPDLDRETAPDPGLAILVIVELIEVFGIERVHTWIRNIAAVQGKEVCRVHE